MTMGLVRPKLRSKQRLEHVRSRALCNGGRSSRPNFVKVRLVAPSGCILGAFGLFVMLMKSGLALTKTATKGSANAVVNFMFGMIQRRRECKMSVKCAT